LSGYTLNGSGATNGIHLYFGSENTAKADIYSLNNLNSPGDGVFVAHGTNGYTTKFLGGTTIGSSSTFQIGGEYMAYNGIGPWAGGSHGVPTYLGIALKSGTDGSTTNYGWIELNYDTTAGTMTVSEFALNSQDGQSIAAGDTGLSAVPEPANTALLVAMGAAGFALYRQRRARAAQAA